MKEMKIKCQLLLLINSFKNMKKNTLIVLAIVIGLIIVAIIVSKKDDISQEVQNSDPGLSSEVTAVFACANNISIATTFTNTDNPENNTIDLNINNGERKMTLNQVVSASGARYANEDESFVFWNKGNTAFIEENGEIIIDNCVDINTQNLNDDSQ